MPFGADSVIGATESQTFRMDLEQCVANTFQDLRA
jgi:hypothetical protein